MRVLHTTQSLGGGVASAIQSYARNTAEHQHFLHGSARINELDLERTAPFEDVQVQASTREYSSTIRNAIRSFRPDVVHAHSSIAGALARILTPRRIPIVYSPHCFAFERLDKKNSSRALFEQVETQLARRTTVLAACSSHEYQRARALGYQDVILVPNVASTGAPPTARRRNNAVPQVATIGRASAQKDPHFFIHVIRRIRQQMSVKAVWIGSGADETVRELRQNDIEVSGWRPSGDLAALLANSDAYIHTAAWEGFPISVLDAHQAGRAVVVRDIAAFSDAPGIARGKSPEDVASLTAEVLRDRTAESRNRAAWQIFLDGHTAVEQGRALTRVYDFAERVSG